VCCPFAEATDAYLNRIKTKGFEPAIGSAILSFVSFSKKESRLEM
jgi:hypothetical protein